MNKAVFLVKRQYNKAVNKLLGIEGRIDLAVLQYDEVIDKLGDAITACKRAGLKEKVDMLKDKVVDVYSKKKKLLDEKAILLAKVKELEAMKQAAACCAKLGSASVVSVETTVNDVKNYIEQLEAELYTAEYFSSLDV